MRPAHERLAAMGLTAKSQPHGNDGIGAVKAELLPSAWPRSIKRRPKSEGLSTGCDSLSWHSGLDPVGCLCSTADSRLLPGREEIG